MFLSAAMLSGIALAGTQAASFQVRLRIAAACQVDEQALRDAQPREAALSRPGVQCSFSTPHTLRWSRESYRTFEAQDATEPVLVKTLEF